MTDPTRNIARSLRAIRREAGMSQAELARATGTLTKHTISKMERGSQGISSAQIELLAKALGVSPARFFGHGPPARQGEPLRPQDVRKSAKGLEEEAVPYTPPPTSFAARVPLAEHESWYRITQSHLDELGLVDGQEIVVSIAREVVAGVRTGDVVLANLYHEGGSAETIVRQFVAPHLLITNSRRNNLASINLETDSARILGVVVHPARARS